MPNSDISVGSNGETIFQGGVRFESDTPILPSRQPSAPHPSIERQRMLGFARWLQCQSSPRTQRVTAGGRVVPAEPNSPPPTFHKPFLDHFVTIAKKDGGQEHEQGEFTGQNPTQQPKNFEASNRNGTSGRVFQVHPALDIPPGFQVLQTQCNGTVAILSSGTTCFFARLTEEGKTSLQIMKPIGEVQNVGPINTYTRGIYQDEQHRVLQQTAAVQNAIAKYQSLLLPKEYEASHRHVSTGDVVFSDWSQPPFPGDSFTSNTASSHSSRRTLSGQPDAGSGEERNLALLEGQPLQAVRSQTSFNQQAAVIASPEAVTLMYEQAIEELTEIDKLIWRESQHRTASELDPLFQKHRDATIRCYQLREQKRYLESFERIDSYPKSLRRRYEVNIPWNPYQPYPKMYQQSQGPTNERVRYRGHTSPLQPNQPNSGTANTTLPSGIGNYDNLSNTMLSATAPSFTPRGGSIDATRGNATQDYFHPQEDCESGDIFVTPRSTEPNVASISFKNALTYRPGNPSEDLSMHKPAGQTHVAGTGKVQEGSSAANTAQSNGTWANIPGGAMKRDAAPGSFTAKLGGDFTMRGELRSKISDGLIAEGALNDSLGEHGGAVTSSIPLQPNSNSARSWTWAKMPDETEEDYAQRLKLRHSQGHGSKPRPRLDDENSPFHATAVVTREPPNSAANSLAASIGQRPEHPSIGMRGGNIRFALVKSTPYYQSVVPQQPRFHPNHRTIPSYGHGSYIPSPVTPSPSRQMPRAYLPTANPYATAPRPHGRRMQSYQWPDQLP